LRILFAGSPAIAVPALKALVELCAKDSSFELAGVLTNPDSPKGRHGKPEPTEVSAAVPAAVPQLKCERLGAAAREQAAALKPDLLAVFAYGRIFGPKFMALFPLGGVNVHPSLLPKYRGAAPIPAAILNRETETGLTIQTIAPEMDSGDILAQERIPLTGRESTASLSELAAQKGADMLISLIQRLAQGPVKGRPQEPGEASYCGMMRKEDGIIDWSKSALEIDARVRAYDPWPLCQTRHGDKALFILKTDLPEAASFPGVSAPGTVLGLDKKAGILVQTGDGLLALQRLQYQGKKALDFKSFLNGARDFIGSRLG
jgi:methionyl-tRNA formyltransferase